MSSNVYLYPQSSVEPMKECKTIICNGNAFPNNCLNNTIEYSRVYNKPPDGKINLINPSVQEDNYARNFGKTNCLNPDGNPTYFSWDPRTFDSTRSQYLYLDRPPYFQGIKLANVYDESLRGYGKNGKSYADVRDGDITYYTGDERKDAPWRPIFSADNIEIQSNIYKTPMDGIIPMYNYGFRKWVNPTTIKNANDELSRCGVGFGLTSINDTFSYRQELFSAYEASLQNKVVR